MKVIKATENDIENLMAIRLEMLKEVNCLSDSYEYDKIFIDRCRKNFIEGNQTNILCMDDNMPVACATLCYISMMPTFSHPTGNRAHLMNVYVRKEYRKKGLAKKMLGMLIEEAKSRGVTEISLDATECGKPLYTSLGFEFNSSAMVMNL